MIRPRPARWFEALVARDDCTLLLEALAATGAVELEARAGATLPEAFAGLDPALERFATYRARYGAWWPKTELRASRFPEAPARTLSRGLATLDAWSREAEGLIREIERCAAEREEARCWQEILASDGLAEIDLAALSRAGPLAQARLLEFAAGPSPQLPPGLLARPIGELPSRFVVIVGNASDLDAAARETTAAKGRIHPIPAWLAPGREQTLATATARDAAARATRERLGRELESLGERHGLRGALGDLLRVEWVIGHVRALESGERFAWVTGWTSDLSGGSLAQAVDRSGARALLHFAAPPAIIRAPLLFSNPRWARPFELFPRALGVPGADEADPTLLLAIAVPLLFGYMFGDLGQGLVIAAGAHAMRRRFPAAKLLVTGGLCAALFGLLFGCVFSLHGAIAPLWIDPLRSPVTVLAIPIAAGALLLAIGLALHALGSFWRGEWARLLGEDLGLIALYAGLIGLPFSASFQWLALVGSAAFVAGHAIHAGRAAAIAAGLGELLERAAQLAINTLSFARVGAFALAHAGLSIAVSALAQEADSLLARVLVIVAGNVIVVALEVMVVSIQTTRLVLFEFFTRFLTGAGRPFRPLAPPPSLVLEV